MPFTPFKGRIVAATNADLDAALKSGKLRADLSYRLQNAQLTIPALRDRAADIIPLTQKFLAAYGSSNPLAPFSLTEAAKKLGISRTTLWKRRRGR